jgi:nucleotide-binding universal stress UspA family protein
LLVAGSRGRSPVARLFLGSVSLELIHKATCSVRVARTGTSSRTGPVRIIIGNDGSTEAEAMVRSVAQRSWPEKAEARVVTVAETLVPAIAGFEAGTYPQEPESIVMREVDEHERVWLRHAAEESATRLRRAGLIVAETVVEGDPRKLIVAEADRWDTDSIFVGARGMGRIERFLLGSVSTYVVKHAPCSVEVVR